MTILVTNEPSTNYNFSKSSHPQCVFSFGNYKVPRPLIGKKPFVYFTSEFVPISWGHLMPQLLPSSLSVLLVTVLRKSKTIDYSPKSHFVPPIYRQYITAVSTNIADISFQLKYRSKYHRYMAVIAIVGEFCCITFARYGMTVVWQKVLIFFVWKLKTIWFDEVKIYGQWKSSSDKTLVPV